MALTRLRNRMFGHWEEERPHTTPLIYLTPTMAARPSVLGHPTDPGFRYAVALFGATPLDRFGKLEPGFPVQVLDPMPEPGPEPTLQTLCQARAAELVELANSADLDIVLLLSGGIDSTAVAVSLIGALEGQESRLTVAYSHHSVVEYPKFFGMLRKRTSVRLRQVHSLREALSLPGLIVTGEHGDQIFGSVLAGELDPQDYHQPWSTVLIPRMKEKLGQKGCRSALSYLEPITALHPSSAPSAFDMLWWWNFSMKWQTVSERMEASLAWDKRANITRRLHHFYRPEPFQRWAMTNRDQCIGFDWASYKRPLKDLILRWTGDRDYWIEKEKQPSLQGIMNYKISARAMDAEGRVFTQIPTHRLKDRDDNGVHISIEIVVGE